MSGISTDSARMIWVFQGLNASIKTFSASGGVDDNAAQWKTMMLSRTGAHPLHSQ
jgi:hypothetical protein